jgi:dGTPase
MEWNKLLNLERLNDRGYTQRKHRPIYSQDIDRILFSQPFRRLANKTQVHPLYDNDHIHHRLIHSLEVTSVGRSLGNEIGAWLADDRKEISVEDISVVAGLVQTACMAHDIGNPPFGHSGEKAIASWFHDQFADPKGTFEDIARELQAEFQAFEGNAQGFRILTRTEMYKNDGGLRLAIGSLGAFTKYPVSASVRSCIGDEAIINGTRYIGIKKYGFFENDTPIFSAIAEELGLPKNILTVAEGLRPGYWWKRHPLAFLMEAADDVCYNIMDLEDAYLADDLDFEVVSKLLLPLVPQSNKAYPDSDKADLVSRYRAQAITGAITACAEAFKENYPDIMNGNFAISLIEASSLSKEFKAIKDTANGRIFSASRKTELEVYGRNVIYRALDGLMPLIDELRNQNWNKNSLSDYHIQLARALKFPLDSADNAYDALHSLTDFVAGMTDRYAVKVADMIGRR